MSRRSQRARRVDYSKIGSVDGISDDDEDKPSRTAAGSDSDEFQLEAAPAGVVDDEDDDDDVMEEAEVEEEAPVRTRVTKAIPKAKQTATRTPSIKLKKSAAKPESLKERFQLFYGSSDGSLVAAINERAKWGDSVFFPRPDLLAPPSQLVELNSPTYVFSHSSQIASPSPMSQAPRYLPHESTVNVQPDSQTQFCLLSRFETSPIHQTAPQSGLILNAGSFVTSAKWAPGHDGPIQYLAVATLTAPTPDVEVDSRTAQGSMGLAGLAARPEISSFNAATDPSSIQIYAVDLTDPSNPTCRLACSICTSYGSASFVSWRPSGPDSPGLVGILASRFQDGRVRVFSVSADMVSAGNSSANCYIISQPLRDYGLDGAIISCLTWRTDNCISVATTDGFIAEFDVSDESPEAGLPSFFAPIHLSLINTITSGFPDRQDLLFTTSTDGYTRLVDVTDLKRSRAVSNRVKGFSTCAAYCPQLCSFVSLEDNVTSKLSPIRRLNIIQGGTNMTRHNGTVTSVATSLQHPLIVSGGSDGSVHIGNAYRRATVSKRQTNAVYKEAILWKFEYSEKRKCFRFIDILKANENQKHQVGETLIVYPREAVVSSLDWNPSTAAGTWYAAGLSCGIVRIENLASKA